MVVDYVQSTSDWITLGPGATRFVNYFRFHY